MRKNLPVCCFLFIIFYCAPAAAYIDPGTGSYFLQAILGFVFAVLYSVRNYFKQLFSRILGSRSK